MPEHGDEAPAARLQTVEDFKILEGTGQEASFHGHRPAEDVRRRCLRCGAFGGFGVEAHDRQDRGAGYEGPVPRYLAPDRVRCERPLCFDGLSIARLLDLHPFGGF